MPASTASGGWRRYSVPLSEFDCSSPGDMTHLELQSTRPLGFQGAGADADFCLGDLEIAR